MEGLGGLEQGGATRVFLVLKYASVYLCVCVCVYVDLGARACVHAHVYVYVCVWISTSGKPWDFYMQHILRAPKLSCPAFQICARVCVCVYVSVQRHY